MSILPIYKCSVGFPVELPVDAWYTNVTLCNPFELNTIDLYLLFFRFPYAETNKSILWTAYVYEAIGLFISANLIVALCSFEFTCFSYLNACIQVLSIRLTKIGNSFEVPARKVNAYKNIVDLMKNHLLVKRLV